MNSYAYDRIADRIIGLLAQGSVPWHKPWKAKTGWPRNLLTKNPYRGINVFLLASMCYESPYWLTYRQALARGGSVRQGEKACPVVFWKQLEIKDGDSDEKRNIPLLRLYHLFNVAQCDGIEDEVTPIEGSPSATIMTERLRQIVADMPQRPPIKHGMTKAFYSPPEDYIGIPAPGRFEREEDYYSALFHEMIHATGHETRLNRATLTDRAGFGTDPYCKEELIAELGATFLCAHAEIAERTIDNSAAYIKAWLERLQEDHTLIVQAAAQAQKAVDFILGVVAPVPADQEERRESPKAGEVAA